MDPSGSGAAALTPRCLRTTFVQRAAGGGDGRRRGRACDAHSAAPVSAFPQLEFGQPDPDPEHPEDEQRVLEDPAGWPWWAWTIILLALVALGVPLAVTLMRKVRRVRSESVRERE